MNNLLRPVFLAVYKYNPTINNNVQVWLATFEYFTLHRIDRTCGKIYAFEANHVQKHHFCILERMVVSLQQNWPDYQWKKSMNNFDYSLFYFLLLKFSIFLYLKMFFKQWQNTFVWVILPLSARVLVQAWTYQLWTVRTINMAEEYHVDLWKYSWRWVHTCNFSLICWSH